jgi:hypothetical protein
MLDDPQALVDPKGRLLVAWKPTTDQFRKLLKFVNGEFHGASTHICPKCRMRYTLYDVGDAEEFVCYNGCEERSNLSEAHNLAEAWLQKQIDDIFG